MCKEKSFVSDIAERGEGVDTLDKPGFVAFGVAEQECLFGMGNSGVEVILRGCWRVGISGRTKFVSDTLLELSFHVFFVE